MNIQRFSEANFRRCISPKGFNHALWSWSSSDWFTAFVGEVGEAGNIIKKLNRVRDGIPGNKETEEELIEDLKKELADVFIYLDLLCQALNVDLAKAVIEKFNAKSAEIGYPEIFEEG